MEIWTFEPQAGHVRVGSCSQCFDALLWSHYLDTVSVTSILHVSLQGLLTVNLTVGAWWINIRT